MFKKGYIVYSAFCTQAAFYPQSAFYTQSAFYPWSSVCSLQSAVHSLRFTLTVFGNLGLKMLFSDSGK